MQSPATQPKVAVTFLAETWSRIGFSAAATPCSVNGHLIWWVIPLASAWEVFPSPKAKKPEKLKASVRKDFL